MSLSRFIGLVLVLIPLGCSDQKSSTPPDVEVRGRILNQGTPYNAPTENLPPGSGALTIVFLSVDRPGTQEFARYDAVTSSFTVPGSASKGLPAGRYKIAISAGASGGMAQRPGNPKLKGVKDPLAEFTPQKTKIVREVKAGEEIVIDLAKPEG
jgi:hypothetical protein